MSMLRFSIESGVCEVFNVGDIDFDIVCRLILRHHFQLLLNQTVGDGCQE